jgi:WD40 repeat protein
MREVAYSVIFSSDGKEIISASKSNAIRIWDASTGLPSLLIEF